MKNEEVEDTRKADLVLPDGFSNEDLKTPGYAEPPRAGAALRADDRARVFQAITSLITAKGLSVSKAIERLRRSGTWNARLGNVKNETWRRYYTMRGRATTCVR